MSILFKSELEKEYDKLKIKRLIDLKKDELETFYDYYNNRLSPAIKDLQKDDLRIIFDTEKVLTKEGIKSLHAFNNKWKDIFEVLKKISKTKPLMIKRGIGWIIKWYTDFFEAKNGGFVNFALYKVGWNEVNNSRTLIEEGKKEIDKIDKEIKLSLNNLNKNFSSAELENLNIKFIEMTKIFAEKIL